MRYLIRVKRLFSLLSGMASFFVLLAACGGGSAPDSIPPGPGETAPVSITIKPSAAALHTGETQLFSATVTGAATNGVLWHVEEGFAGGTIDANGLYRAPSLAGTYHVVVASQADATQTASAVVTVTPAGVVLPPPSTAEPVSTSPGSLDAGFGKSGIVSMSPGFGSDLGNGVVLQPLQQGVKILVVGHAFNGVNNDFLLVRYNGDGSLDTSFGKGGKVLTDFGSDDGANAVALDSTGRIVVAGYAYNGNDYDFAVARYNSVGGLDTTFGAGGKVHTPIGTRNDFATGLVIRPDGQIFVAGSADMGGAGGTNFDFALVIYDDVGHLDTGAVNGGKITTDFGGKDDSAYAVGIQSDNKIVVAGDSNNGSNLDFAIVRYTPTGALDSTFGPVGSGGEVTSSIGAGDDSIRAMAITGNGIVVAGFTDTGTREDMALARYDINGFLDPTFNFNGIATARIGAGNSFALALAIQSNNILVSGGAYNGANNDFALARFNSSGSLDPSFGTPGSTVTDFGSGDDTAYALVVQADGKIVAAGETSAANNRDLAVARYNADGTIDTSFRTGGKQTFNFEKSSGQAEALAVQADGKIIAAGDSLDGDSFTFTLVRYGSNGDLDPSFGESGKRATFFNGGAGGKIVIQPDGKIVAAGTFYQNGNNDFALARYDANGTLEEGITIGLGQNGENQDFVGALALQSDGKIVVAGSTSAGSDYDFGMIRINADGTLDSSFGTNSETITSFGSGNDIVNGIAIQPDGKILLAGSSRNGSIDNFALARYNPDGKLDLSFGTGGKVLTPVGASGNGAANVVRVQPDGKIIAGGYTLNNKNYDFALVRYNRDGSLDPTFGKNGKVTTPIDTGNDGIYDLTLQPDGKIVAAGYSNVLDSDFAVARYNADGTLDPSFGQSGKKILKIGGSSDFAFAVALQSDGKIVAAGGSWAGTHYEFALARFWP